MIIFLINFSQPCLEIAHTLLSPTLDDAPAPYENNAERHASIAIARENGSLFVYNTFIASRTVVHIDSPINNIEKKDEGQSNLEWDMYLYSIRFQDRNVTVLIYLQMLLIEQVALCCVTGYC